MAAPSAYNTQVSADGYSQRYGHHRRPSPTTSLSPTLVNDTHYTARPSLKLRIAGGASNILNSRVVDAAGQSLYLVSSDSKRTTLVSCRDNVEVATVQWDRHSPRMVFHRKKMKCKEWLRLAGPDNESRILTHGDAQFTWMQRQGSSSGHLIPADRPGLAVARWKIKSRTDELTLEIFQEVPLAIQSGLLDAIVLSVVLLRSGQSLGDSPGEISLSNPVYAQVLQHH